MLRPHPLTLKLEERALTRLAIWPLTSELMTLAWKTALLMQKAKSLYWLPDFLAITLASRSASQMGRKSTSLKGKGEERQALLHLGFLFFFFLSLEPPLE